MEVAVAALCAGRVRKVASLSEDAEGVGAVGAGAAGAEAMVMGSQSRTTS